MVQLNKYSLTINDKELAREYLTLHTKQIFITGIIILVIRLIRIILSIIILDQQVDVIPYFVPTYTVFKWVTFGIQIVTVIL